MDISQTGNYASDFPGETRMREQEGPQNCARLTARDQSPSQIVGSGDGQRTPMSQSCVSKYESGEQWLDPLELRAVYRPVSPICSSRSGWKCCLASKFAPPSTSISVRAELGPL